MPFYGVSIGWEPGVYEDLEECKRQVRYPEGKYEAFETYEEAAKFVVEYRQQKVDEALARWFREDLNISQTPQPIDDYDNWPSTSRKHRHSSDVKVNEDIPKKILKKPQTNDVSEFMNDTKGDLELLNAVGAEKDEEDKPIQTSHVDNWYTRRIINARYKLDNENQIYKTVQMGPHKFFVDEDDFVQVYIAGEYENIGKWNGVAGYGIHFGDDHFFNYAGPCRGRMSNNIGDLEAAIRTIKVSKKFGISKLVIHTNSEYLLKAVGNWMAFWKRQNWRTLRGKKVYNLKQFKLLDNLLHDQAIQVKWLNSKDEEGRLSRRALAAVKRLAEIGKDDYLCLHPSKDIYFYETNYFDFEFFESTA